MTNDDDINGAAHRQINYQRFMHFAIQLCRKRCTVRPNLLLFT